MNGERHETAPSETAPARQAGLRGGCCRSEVTAVPGYAASAFAGEVQTASGTINVLGSDGMPYQIGATVQSATGLRLT